MNRHLLTLVLLGIISSISFSQGKKNDLDIPFKIAMGYFVKNTFTKDKLPKAKITTQKEFDEFFGAAAFMGENGLPTQINFKKQYVIAVIEKVTDLDVRMTPISLKKKANKIVFEYSIVSGKQQSFSIQPLIMILVDKKFTGKVETFNPQTKVENPENNTLKMLNNQWIIEYFNNPERSVDSKNCYINIDLNKGNFSGNDGCNILNGKVKIEGESISFENILRTKRACKNMEQGNVFVKNLNNVNRFEIKGGELFLFNNDLLIMTLESFR